MGRCPDGPCALFHLGRDLGIWSWSLFRHSVFELRHFQTGCEIGLAALCVAGAFTLGFTSMTAVFLSNLGTYGAYSLANGTLRDLGRPAPREREPMFAIVARMSSCDIRG